MFPNIRLEITDKDASGNRHRGVKWYFYLLFSNFSRFVCLNLLTLGCCLSVILLPAGISAACRAMLTFDEDRDDLFWEEYRAEFKDQMVKKFGFWVLMMLMPLALAGWIQIIGLGDGVKEWIFYIGLLVSFVAQAYFFVVAAAMDLPLSSCLANALGLMVLEWPTTLCLAASFALTAVLGFMLYPYSLLFMVVLFFSCMVLFVCLLCLRVLHRRKLLLPRSDHEEE